MTLRKALYRRRDAVRRGIRPLAMWPEIDDELVRYSYKFGFDDCLELLWPCVEALECNEQMHSLNGLDDCRICNTLKELKRKVGM